MVICFDAGNTDLVAGIFCDDAVKDIIRIPYKRGLSAAEYYSLISKYMQDNSIDISSVEGCLLCCVAKGTAEELSCAIGKLFGKKPVMFSNDETCQLKILTEDPNEVGTDIIAGCMTVKEKYTLPAVVVDMGTGTTLTAMDKDGSILGVSIVPGILIALQALNARTGLPIDESLTAPAKVIGTNTADSIASGVVFGNAFMMDGMISAFEKEMGTQCNVYCTGGGSKYVMPFCQHPHIINENLLLEGLYIYYKNHKGI